jgi:hypothetical protein
MATSELWGALGTETILGTNTNLSALANNALFLSGDYNNVQAGGGGGGDVLCRLRAILTMAVAAAANTGFSVWFLKSVDGGTTWERGGTGYTPLRLPDCVFPAPVDTTQTEITRDVLCPAGHFKVLIKNDGTGQALKTDTTSAGSQLSIIPFTRQSV